MAVLALLLLATPCGADGPDVMIENAKGSCRVRGSFLVSATVEIAWAVLTDYDHIGEYVRSIRASRMERQADGRSLLRQETVATALFMRRRVDVLLALQESPRARIAFHDELKEDFDSYAGEWRITPGSAGTRVDYELAAEPRGVLARTFCRGAMRSGARELLEQVRTEMLRRARGGARP
jgi:carbon monoxide dehydrogenase subunit G